MLASPSIAAADPRADLSGDWVLTTTALGVTSTARLTIDAHAAVVRDDTGAQPATIAIDHDRVQIAFGAITLRGGGGALADAVSGELVARGARPDDRYTGTWSAHRMATDRPPAPRELAIATSPSTFVRDAAAAAAAPPVLHAWPRDTIALTTIDADATGAPLTGPIYVETAMPGDVVVVHLRKLAGERDATGDRPTDRPTLGAIAVAPHAGATPGARDVGDWGGDLALPELAAGATIYLPVHQAGALLAFGDGRTTAQPAALSIELVVDVRPGPIHAPRIEDDDHVIAIGIAASLADATARATAELADWLVADFHVTRDRAARILTAALEVHAETLASGDIEVVATLPKDRLAQVTP